MSDGNEVNEQLLIDYVLGRCDETQLAEIRRRLQKDARFEQLHGDIRRTFRAIDLLEDVDPPADLAERTLRAVRSRQQTEALLAREQASRRRSYWPTFSIREAAALAASLILLASVFIPSMRFATQRADRQACMSRLGQLGTAMATYAGDNGGYLPSAAGSERWLPNGQDAYVSNSAGLFRLIRDKYSQTRDFQCPAVGNDSFVVQAGMADFPAGRFVTYSYQHAVGRGVSMHDPELLAVADNMAILADGNPLFRDGQFQPRSRDGMYSALSENHNHTGQNVLFLGGHVRWTQSPNVGVDGDNIWLIQGVYDYTGTERPTSKTDSFLLPAAPRN